MRRVWNECSNVSEVTADRPLWSMKFLFGVYLLNKIDSNKNNQGKGMWGICLFVVGRYKKFNSLTDKLCISLSD